jgi:O-antigen ligase
VELVEVNNSSSRINKVTIAATAIVVALLGLVIGIEFSLGLLLVLLGGFIIVSRPELGIMLFALTYPFLGDMKIMVLSFLVLAVYLFKALRDGKIEFDRVPVTYPIIFYVVVLLFSSFLSVNPSGSLRDLALNITGMFFVFIAMNYEMKKKTVFSIIKFMILSSFFVSLYGIYQYIVGVPMESGWVDQTQNTQLKMRIYSTFENPNVLAEYLVMMIPVSVAYIVYNKNWGKKILFGAMCLVQILCIGLTYSRGGWLGLVVSCGLFLVISNYRFIFLMIPMGLLGLYLMPSSILQRISTIGSLKDSSNFYRFNLWQKSVDIIKDFWMSGIGLGYKAFMDITPLYIKNANPYHVHNTYIQLMIETGIFGLLSFLLMIISLVKMGFEVFSSKCSREIKILIMAFVCGILGVMVHGIAEHVLFNPKIIYSFWFNISIIVMLYRLHKKEAR